MDDPRAGGRLVEGDFPAPLAFRSFSASLPSPATLARRRILAVDNEAASTRLVRLTLERSGLFDVCEVNDPLLTLAAARLFQPHLVLLDIEMPGLDGSGVAAQLRADGAFRHLPILFMTSLVTPEEADRHLYTADSRVLAKPVTIAKLMQAVAEMLSNSLAGESLKLQAASSKEESRTKASGGSASPFSPEARSRP